MEELSDFGEDIQSCSSCCLEELSSMSPGYNFVKEVHPVFIIPGLQGPSEKVLEPLARYIMYPVFCAKLPSKFKSIPETAAILAQRIQEVQKIGPYNLIGVSWGGALTLEVTKLLETQGHETRVVLLDGALETLLSLIGLLDDDSKMQANLICRLLNINNTKVQEELIQLPDWPSRIDYALSKVPQELKTNEENLRIGMTAIADRIEGILRYQHPSVQLNGDLILLRPIGATGGYCGVTQFFRKTVNVSMLDGNHRSILSNRKVAEKINTFVM